MVYLLSLDGLSHRFPLEAAQTLKLTLPPPLENIYIFCKEGVVMNKKDNVKQDNG